MDNNSSSDVVKSDNSDNNKGSKTAAIVIFVCMCIFLIFYVVYMYEAFKGQFFPFGWNAENMKLPPDAVLPMGKVLEEDDSVLPDDVSAQIGDILALNNTWYTDNKCIGNTPGVNCSIPLNNGVKVLGSDSQDN